MKKAIFVAVVGLVLALAAPSFAQGPFADVPVDHWAYEAVSQLQSHGIVIGYPDGTFSGKRALTRYEFALALSRAIPVIQQGMVTPPASGQGVTAAEVQKMIDDSKVGPGASQADVDALKKSINEFKDELSSMGVDLDALKRDVANLEERVATIEAELKRLKITTKFTVFGITSNTFRSKAGAGSGNDTDRDNRPLAGAGNTRRLINNVATVRDADVIFSYQNGKTKGKIVINAGNYLNYLTGGAGMAGPGLTNFSGAARTTASAADYMDQVNLFMAYGEVPILGVDVSVGRFPIQFTKWTMKKFDVDSYTDNWKTDDGNYYVDGAKAAWTWGGVDILAFAGKNNSNGGFYNYTSRPSQFINGGSGGFAFATGPGNLLPASALSGSAFQSAGVRGAFGLGAAKVGLTWLSAAAPNAFFGQANIYGGDVDFNISTWKWYASYTKSDTTRGGLGVKINKQNSAWEIGTRGAFGGFGVMAAYKQIEPNFSAPGDWGRIGRWQNPFNIKGPEVGLTYGLGERLNLSASGAWYTGVKNSATTNVWAAGTNATGTLPPAFDKNSRIQHYKAGVGFQLSPKGSLNADAEWVRWNPRAAGFTGKPVETYYTFSYNHVLTDNSKLKLLYQMVDYKAKGNAVGPYGAADYEGGVAAAQVSMDF